MSNIQIFRNEQFGEVRAIEINGTGWLVGKDAAEKLGYSNTRDALAKHVDEDKPKVVFADSVTASSATILIGDLAKIMKQNGVDIGQKRLFEWLRNNGYLIKSGSSRNMPTQKAANMGLFFVKESSMANPDGSVRVTKTTKVTGKGQIYFINKLQDRVYA